MVSIFLKSRRQGLSRKTLKFYEGYLRHSSPVIGLNTSGQDIARFLDFLQCSNGGKHAYFRALRVFYNWLYSPKSGFKLNLQDNPILLVEAPKVEKQILPSLTNEEVSYLVGQAENLKDKAIISLFTDSGMRLSELAGIEARNIDWLNYTVTIWGKGNKQRKAVFTERTAKLLREIVDQNGTGENIWHMKAWGIVSMLKRLKQETGLPCNPHTFRRTFASNLHRAGMDIEHIMRLGGWESLDMVLRYTRSVKFEDSVKHYRALLR
ncbi:MAG: tyrosine-type recombinase/integrase [Chloroflexi bacterium]|nr:tyrosine-type recombinase/integrase [Chloroflexota bacterium]